LALTQKLANDKKVYFAYFKLKTNIWGNELFIFQKSMDKENVPGMYCQY